MLGDDDAKAAKCAKLSQTVNVTPVRPLEKLLDQLSVVGRAAILAIRENIREHPRGMVSSSGEPILPAGVRAHRNPRDLSRSSHAPLSVVSASPRVGPEKGRRCNRLVVYIEKLALVFRMGFSESYPELQICAFLC